MEKWKGKIAVVTGAGAGIGAAIASELVNHGMTVVGMDVKEDNVQKLAERLSNTGSLGKLYSLKVDLRKEEDILSAFKWVEVTLGGADVLVNNAGVVFTDLLIDGVTEEWRQILEVNVLAVSLCTREFLQSMKRRGCDQGHIIMIQTVAAHMTSTPFPTAVMYIASKHAIKAITQCLRQELAERGSTIKVTGISPGRVRTDIVAKGTGPEGSRFVVMLEPEDVAAAVTDILSTSSVSQICDIMMTPVPTILTVY